MTINDLYKTALLGTNRMTPSVSTLDLLREMGIETDDATEAVLTGVGMLGLARKAGFPLMDFEGTLPTACPMETKKYMSLRAANYVQDVLEKKLPVFVYLHAHFLDLIAECATLHNKIVPIFILPTLLEALTLSRPTDPALIMLGERGVWLASQNPQWKSVLEVSGKPRKMSAGEVAAVEILRGVSLKSTPNLYNDVFDTMRQIGLIEDNAARVALFWVSFVQEMEK